MAAKAGYTTYIVKDGCRVSPSCYTCPLEQCIFDVSAVSVMETVKVLAGAGVSDETISEKVSVSTETLRRWRRLGDIP